MAGTASPSSATLKPAVTAQRGVPVKQAKRPSQEQAEALQQQAFCQAGSSVVPPAGWDERTARRCLRGRRPARYSRRVGVARAPLRRSRLVQL
jgi:hypothetical protein